MISVDYDLRLSGIHHSYGLQPALRGIDLDVGPGERVALMGPSGCGKSTLLLIAGGIVVPSEGTVALGEEDISRESVGYRAFLRRSKLGIVFQFGELISEFSLRENVALAAEMSGMSRKVSLAEADAILGEVGLGDLRLRRPSEVSGGQAQRCAVARGLVHRPSLVLADEPTGALDRGNAVVVLDLILRIARERGASLLMATHDPEVSAECDRTIQMLDGLTVE